MKFFFETYGCQMNVAESSALKLTAKEQGWQEADNPDEADLILLNTCSVRITAEDRVMGRLAHYAAIKKKGGSFTLVLAGCMAERTGKKLKLDFPALDYTMGTSERSLFPVILKAAEQGGRADFPAPDITEKPQFSFSSSHLEEGGFRSFVPIMHGCNNYCSYCIVPYVRGPEISRAPQEIINEIRLLGENGVREITLLGQNVNSYKWEQTGFSGLLELVAAEVKKTPIRWVRFLSSHPKDLCDEAIRVMAENPVFCRHLHLCVQSGSNIVLEAMNRKYTREQYLDLVSRLRSAMPGLTLSTDILASFPGETEDDLEQTLNLMEQVKFLYSYMYHYNPREGTEAFKLPNRVPDEIKGQRLDRIIKLQKQHTMELLKNRIGVEETVLIEGISRKNADELITRTEKDEMAAVPGSKSWIGRFGMVKLESLKGNTFRAGELKLIQEI